MGNTKETKRVLTKDGFWVTSLERYGYDWGMTYVNGGCDEANIDTGDSAALEDFFTYLENESDLTINSIEFLKEDWNNDLNWAWEVECGASEALQENGYKEVNNLYFIKD